MKRRGARFWSFIELPGGEGPQSQTSAEGKNNLEERKSMLGVSTTVSVQGKKEEEPRGKNPPNRDLLGRGTFRCVGRKRTFPRQ